MESTNSVVRNAIKSKNSFDGPFVGVKPDKSAYSKDVSDAKKIVDRMLSDAMGNLNDALFMAIGHAGEGTPESKKADAAFVERGNVQRAIANLKRMVYSL